MKYQLTNEQALQLFNLMVDVGESNCAKEVSEWLSANLPAPVPVLRPIQEMPPELPGGTVVLWGTMYSDGSFGGFTTIKHDMDTHFVFVRAPRPDPEAELRKEFEDKFPNLRKEQTPSGMYADRSTQCVWEGFQAGKEAGCR